MSGHFHLGIPTFIAFLVMLGMANIIMRIVAGWFVASDVPVMHTAGEALGFAY